MKHLKTTLFLFTLFALAAPFAHAQITGAGFNIPVGDDCPPVINDTAESLALCFSDEFTVCVEGDVEANDKIEILGGPSDVFIVETTVGDGGVFEERLKVAKLLNTYRRVGLDPLNPAGAPDLDIKINLVRNGSTNQTITSSIQVPQYSFPDPTNIIVDCDGDCPEAASTSNLFPEVTVGVDPAHAACAVTSIVTTKRPPSPLVTWNLAATFSSPASGTAAGFIEYDADADTLGNFSITVDAGTGFAAVTYTPAWATGSVVTADSAFKFAGIDPTTSTLRSFELSLSAPLTNAGGIVPTGGTDPNTEWYPTNSPTTFRQFTGSLVDTCPVVCEYGQVITVDCISLTNIIQFVDTNAPILTCPDTPLILDCGDTTPAPRLVATDTCAGDIPALLSATTNLTAGCLTVSDVQLYDRITTPAGHVILVEAGTTNIDNVAWIVTNIWTATDPCRNFATCTQVVYYTDTTGPTFECPDDLTLDCVPTNEAVFVLGAPGSVPAIDTTTPVTNVAVTPPDNPADRLNGLTFHISFTPSAEDVADGTNRVLMEIGGSSNGSGLYLIDGVPTFVSKMNGVFTDLPSLPLNDLDWEPDNTVAVQHSGGALSPGVATEIVVVFDITQLGDGTLQFMINGVLETFDFVNRNGRNFWDGDNTFSVGVANGPGGLAGSGPADSDFLASNYSDLSGTLDQARYWNALGTFECELGSPVAFETMTLPATDNCDTNPLFATATVLPMQAVCPTVGVWQVTWSAKDRCGNETICTQMVYQVDNTPPEICDGPADIFVPCGIDPFPPAATPQDIIALDGCDADLDKRFVRYVPLAAPPGCPTLTVFEVIYTVEDDCGNASFYTQTMSQVDLTPPSFPDCVDVQGTPVFGTAALQTLRNFGNLGLTISEDVSFEVVIQPTDLVGQEIIFESGGTTGAGMVLDGSNLIFSVAQTTDDLDIARVSHTLNADVLGKPLYIFATFDIGTDTVSLYVNGALVGSYTLSVAPGIIVWTGGNAGGFGFGDGNALGGFGNGFDHLGGTFTGLVNEVGHTPEFRIYQGVLELGLPTQTLSCEETYTPTPPTAVDGCVDPTVELFSSITNDLFCAEEQIINVWSATDGCHTSFCTETINITDDVPPSCTPPELITVGCIDEIPTGDELRAMWTNAGGTATDTCGGVEILYLGFFSEPDPGNCDQTVQALFLIFDECGNETFCDWEIIIHDDIPPAGTLINPTSDYGCVDGRPDLDDYCFCETNLGTNVTGVLGPADVSAPLVGGHGSSIPYQTFQGLVNAAHPMGQAGVWNFPAPGLFPSISLTNRCTVVDVSATLGSDLVVVVSEPPDVTSASLTLWLDAADINGAGDGATGDPAAGATVTSWADKSGIGNNAGTGAGVVTVSNVDTLNGKPLVNFAPSSWLDFPNLTAQGTTVFTVHRNTPGANTGWVNLLGGNLHTQDPTELRRLTVGLGQINVSSGISAQQFAIQTMQLDGDGGNTADPEGDNYTLWIDGTQYGPDVTDNGASFNPFTVIGNIGGADVAEVLIYDGVLSGVERLAVEAYLNDKWFDAEEFTSFPASLLVDATNNYQLSLDFNVTGPTPSSGISKLGFFIVEPDDPCIYGQRIRVTNPALGGVQKFIHLRELEVYSDGINVALNGTASASTAQFDGGVSCLTGANVGPGAININDNCLGTWNHTSEGNQWVEINLSTEMKIDEIVLRSRFNNSARLNNYFVEVFDAGGVLVWSSGPNPTVPGVANFQVSDCPPPGSTFTVEFMLDDGTSGVEEYTMNPDNDDDEDTFFGYAAPPGRTITGVFIDGNGAPEVAKAFHIDDLSYVLTCGGTVEDPANLFADVDDCNGPVLIERADPFETTNTVNCRTTLSRHYILSDVCGNSTTQSQEFTWIGVTDHEPPTIVSAPDSPQHLGCNPVDPDADPDHGDTDDMVPHDYDDYNDNGIAYPILNGNGTHEEHGGVTLIPTAEEILAQIIATDNCEIASIELVKIINSQSGCNRERSYYYRIADGCWNVLECVHTLTWTVDTTPPVLLVDKLTLGCNPNLIPPPLDTSGVDATDDCGLASLVMTNETILDVYSNGCTFVMTRYYLAVDECFNSNSVPQMITWTEDIEPPASVWPPDSFYCVDSLEDAQDYLADLGEKKWTSTGVIMTAANNPFAPEFSNAFATLTVPEPPVASDLSECVIISAVAHYTVSNVTAYSNAFVDITVAGSSTGSILGTNGAIPLEMGHAPATQFPDVETIEFLGQTASTNDGGGTMPATIEPGDELTIYFFDTVGHFGTNWTADVTVTWEITYSCNDGLAFLRENATDQCGDVSVLALGTHTSALQNCGFTVTEAYGILDSCGNMTPGERHHTFTIDGEAPTLLVDNLDLGCNPGYIPTINELEGVNAFDGCADVVITGILQSASPPGCTVSQVVEYVAVDACGNTITGLQSITYTLDTETPVITTHPGGGHVGCSVDNVPVPSDSDISGTDNCPDLTPAFISGITNQLDACTREARHTYRLTDGCGNFDEHTVVWTWTTDEIPPEFIDLPQTIELGCNAGIAGSIPAPDVTRYAVTDNCAIASTSWVTDSVPTVVGCQVTMYRTYQVVDGCNNMNTETATFTWVQDTTPPVSTYAHNSDLGCLASGEAANLLPSTAEEAAAIQAALEDACSGSGTSEFIQEVVQTNQCRVTMLRTYRVQDACANLNDVLVDYTWVINDNTLAATVPEPTDLGCNPTIPVADISVVTVSGLENCGTHSVTLIGDSTVLGDCGIEVERVYEVADECESLTVTQVFWGIADNSAGVIDVDTPELDLGCADLSDVPDPTNVAFLGWDNCNTNIQVGDVVIEVVTQLRTACETVIDHLYTFTDACGNRVRARRTVRLQEYGQDTEAPQFVDLPQLIDLGCNPDQLESPDVSSISVTDNCAVANVAWLMDMDPATGTAPEIDGAGECYRTNRRYYVATDICGNVSTGVVVYTWKVDVEQPTFTQGRPELFGDLGCNPTLRGINIEPDVGSVFGNDNCDGTPIPASLAADLRITNGCEVSVVYVYRLADECGNSVEERAQFRYTVDTDAPSIDSAPANQNLGCNPLVIPNPDFTQFTVSEGCGNYEQSVARQQVPNGCDVTISDVYTFTDECGNRSSATQEITYTVDEEAPRFDTFPVDEYLGCNTSPDAPYTGVAASDNCSVSTNVEQLSLTSEDCLVTMVREYTATDGCGNITKRRHTLTWTADTTPPSFVAPTLDLGCNPSPIPPTDVDSFETFDDCQVVSISQIDETDPVENGCDYSLTRTFEAIDGCGNRFQNQQVVTWTVDTKDPVIDPIPENDLGCNPSNVPPADTGVVVARDNCGIMLTTVIIDVTNNVGCAYQATRVYRVMDFCGHFADEIAITSWTEDSEDPSIVCPADVDLGCNPGAIPPAAIDLVDASDNCGVDSIVLVDSVDTNDGCTWTRTHTFQATDTCGNQASCEQVVTWTVDVTPPTIDSAPLGGDLGCGDTVPTPSAGDVTASDDCGSVSTEVVTVINAGVAPCTVEERHIYRVSDACGNLTEHSVSWTYTDDSAPPVFVDLPQTIALGCNPNGVPAPDDTRIEATDNCGISSVYWPTSGNDVVSSNGCDRSMERHYVAVDNCGHSATGMVTITWREDLVPPTITKTEPSRDLGCNPGAPPAPNLSLVEATDNCGSATVSHVSDVENVSGCDHTLVRTYRATDECGNLTDAQTILTWREDTTPPVITICPEGRDLGCNPQLPDARPDLVAAEDECGGVSVVVLAQSVTNVGCAHTFTITYGAIDDCNNTAECEQVFTYLVDTTPPMVLSSTAGGNLGCDPQSLPTQTPVGITAVDDCGAEPTISFSSQAQQKNGCQVTLVQTFRVADSCGNEVEQDVIYTWTDDTQAPVVDCLVSELVAERTADGDLVVPDVQQYVQFSDECGGATFSQVPAANAEVEDKTEIIVTITDACGHSSSCSISLRADTVNIEGVVWNDTGILQGDPGLAVLVTVGLNGIPVELCQIVPDAVGGGLSTNCLLQTVTDTAPSGELGFYQFLDVPPGDYLLRMDGNDLPSGLQPASTGQGETSGNGTSRLFTVNPDGSYVFTGTPHINATGDLLIEPGVTTFGFSTTATAAELTALDATGGTLAWTVGFEDDVLGYNVIDAATGEQINEGLILAEGNDSAYSVDLGPGAYILQEVGTDLDVTEHEVTHYAEVDASPNGEPVNVMEMPASRELVTSSAYESYFVSGAGDAAVIDVSDPENPVRLICNQVATGSGTALYFSYPAGATLRFE